MEECGTPIINLQIAGIITFFLLIGILIGDFAGFDFLNQRGSDWAIYKTEQCKELGGIPNKLGGYCNIESGQILYGQLENKSYRDGLKEGIFLGIDLEKCTLEEQAKGIIVNPIEYCYNKIMGKELQENLN